MSAPTKRLSSLLRGVTIASLWLVIGMAHAGTKHYYYTDPQGTVLAKADEQGTIISRNDYAPYGSASPNMDAAPDGPGYTGHVNDPDTGLVYMQARYYDPVVGRFLSEDPVGPAVGNPYNFNRFAYANNNPVVNTDPTGTTCHRSGSKGSYSCQIDYVVGKVDGKISVRAATAADHKTYAGVENSLTKAVNAAASSGKTVAISVKEGGSTFSFKISGARIAQDLVGRNMIVDPNGNYYGAMYSPNGSHDTYINKSGISPAQHTRYGNSDRTRSIYFLHEGIHDSREEERGFGNAIQTLGTDPKAHQDSYNNAASKIMGNQ